MGAAVLSGVAITIRHDPSAWEVEATALLNATEVTAVVVGAAVGQTVMTDALAEPEGVGDTGMVATEDGKLLPSGAVTTDGGITEEIPLPPAV